MTHSYARASGLSEVSERRPTSLAIGVFDGVHLGHQVFLKHMSTAAIEAGVRSAVMTFYPHPRSVIPGRIAPQYLTTLDERVELIAEQGIDLVIVQRFDDELRKTKADEFVDRLCETLDLRQLWGGHFGIGHNREGNAAFLRQKGEEKGFSVHRFSEYAEWLGQPVSSSRVRRAVRKGDMESASRLLNRPYRMRGWVIQGDGRGRRIGVPTANLSVWEEQVMPLGGVYATYALLDGRRFPAATNIGVRPTVNGRTLIVEAHLLDFDGDLYGRDLALDFVTRIRDEKKFPGLDSLVAQIRSDIELVRQKLRLSAIDEI